MLRMVFPVVAAFCLFAAPASGQSFERPSFIQWQIAGIRAETNVNIRRAKAEYMLEGIREGRAGEISDADIDDLASLLPDLNMQIYAAAALMHTGPRAKRAVPALVKAINGWHARVNEGRTGVWPAPVMCNALTMIDYSQLPDDCSKW